MGTVVSIELADDLPEPSLRAMIADVCEWLHLVDARFSTYKDDSEVSRLLRKPLDPKGNSNAENVTVLRGNGKPG